MPGTTIHTKMSDVIISIDIKRYIADGNLAYLSPNGVVLFPNKVNKEYLTEAYDRKKNCLLIRQPRSPSQVARLKRQSSREDEPVFRCPRCGSMRVRQDQGPYSWPGNIYCEQCKSEQVLETCAPKSFATERTKSMPETEKAMSEATAPDEQSRRKSVSFLSQSRTEAKRGFESQQIRLRDTLAPQVTTMLLW